MIYLKYNYLFLTKICQPNEKYDLFFCSLQSKKEFINEMSKDTQIYSEYAISAFEIL